MQSTVQAAQYNSITIILHWLMALIVIALFSSGYWMVELNYYSAWYKTAPHWHKSVGLLMFLLLLCRFANRWRSGAVRAIASHSPVVQKAARWTHKTLYVLMLLIPISGYLISTADGRPIELFDWFLIPSAGELFPEQADFAGIAHRWLAYGLIALAATHAIAALKHHFLDKDQTLNRMLGRRY